MLEPGSYETVIPPGKEEKDKQWRLVWCHELCHKPASQELRSVILHLVEKGGGRFTCHKKAARFLDWWVKNGDIPFVLLTDWREVKPCLAGLKTTPCSAGTEICSLSAESPAPPLQPIAICVVAQTPQVYHRASEWAKTESFPSITVVNQLNPATLKDYLSTRCGIPFVEAASGAPAEAPAPLVVPMPVQLLPPSVPKASKAFKASKAPKASKASNWSQERVLPWKGHFKEEEHAKTSEKVAAPPRTMTRATLHGPRGPQTSFDFFASRTEQHPCVWREDFSQGFYSGDVHVGQILSL
eukprot:TRINITY_DN38983_c0_g1_i1.p1 TRINITY_DN38983_c0_g1~~TRINITY_DN38983_c0_g1_i1.p1  ORF type:complete len:298 (+),score=48.50 TRINITY_DN38983_c0_g1_i1:143-1036(+)